MDDQAVSRSRRRFRLRASKSFVEKVSDRAFGEVRDGRCIRCPGESAQRKIIGTRDDPTTCRGDVREFQWRKTIQTKFRCEIAAEYVGRCDAYDRSATIAQRGCGTEENKPILAIRR